jgi:hypothetical protein
VLKSRWGNEFISLELWSNEKNSSDRGFCVKCVQGGKLFDCLTNRLNDLLDYFNKFDQRKFNFAGIFSSDKKTGTEKHYEQIIKTVSLNNVYHNYKKQMFEVIGLEVDVKRVVSQVGAYISSISQVSSVKTEPQARSDFWQADAGVKQERFQATSKATATVTPSQNVVVYHDRGIMWSQLEILILSDFSKQINISVPDVRVRVSENEVNYTSTDQSNIERARQVVSNILKGIIVQEVSGDKMVLQNVKNYKQAYLDYIKRFNLCCVIDSTSDENCVFIYGIDNEKIEKCKKAIANPSLLHTY